MMLLNLLRKLPFRPRFWLYQILRAPSVSCVTLLFLCVLLQYDPDGYESVVAQDYCQLNASEKKYPVHYKELLATKYSTVQPMLHLLSS